MNYLANVSVLRVPSAAEDVSPVDDDRRSPHDEPSMQSSPGSVPERDSSTGATVIRSGSSNGEQKTQSLLTKKTKTVFKLAYPPPATQQQKRLHIRPKLLLQLHRTSNAARPTPVFDVLPSFLYDSHLLRRLPWRFRSKSGLGPKDLVIVSSQVYDKPDTQNFDDFDLLEDDDQDDQEIIAVCQLRESSDCFKDAEIWFGNDVSWKASQLPSGTYEFVELDDLGYRKVVRWVPRRNKSNRKQPIASGRTDKEGPDVKQFTFSILDPQARRHAIIATLNSDEIDILDRYSMPSPLTPSLCQGSKINAKQSNAEQATMDLTERCPIVVDDCLRALIVVTGIWVAFLEGFSKGFSRNSYTAPLRKHIESLHHKERSLPNDLASSYDPTTTLHDSLQKMTLCGARNAAQQVASRPVVPAFAPTHRTKMPTKSFSTGSELLHILKKSNHRFPILGSHHLSPVPSSDESEVEGCHQYATSHDFRDTPSKKASSLPQSVVKG